MQGQPPPTTHPPSVSSDAVFEDAYRTSGTAVLGYALRRSTSREDALDVVAETFAVAWRRRMDMPADPEEIRPWLFGIARRCLANAARSTQREGRLGERLADRPILGSELRVERASTAAVACGGPTSPSLAHTAVPDPSTLHENRAEGRLVRAALGQLSPEDRELVTLIAWEGLTPAQAATALGLSAGPPASGCTGPAPACAPPCPPPHTRDRYRRSLNG